MEPRIEKIVRYWEPDPETGELMSLRQLAEKYDLPYKLTKDRHRRGWRGAKLVQPIMEKGPRHEKKSFEDLKEGNHRRLIVLFADGYTVEEIAEKRGQEPSSVRAALVKYNCYPELQKFNREHPRSVQLDELHVRQACFRELNRLKRIHGAPPPDVLEDDETGVVRAAMVGSRLSAMNRARSAGAWIE